MAFRIRLSEEAAAAFRILAPATKKRLRAAMAQLANDPAGADSGLDVAELDTEGVPPPMYRLRSGDWRVAFQIVDRDVQVIRIFHRREGYAWIDDPDEGEN
ncbi:MAG: type II toxin-antitoxin system RelE family toxin [Thermoplasmatota archaeon]